MYVCIFQLMLYVYTRYVSKRRSEANGLTPNDLHDRTYACTEVYVVYLWNCMYSLFDSRS